MARSPKALELRVQLANGQVLTVHPATVRAAEYVRANPGCATLNVQAAFNISQQAAYLRLRRAFDAGLVTMEGHTRTVRWFPTGYRDRRPNAEVIPLHPQALPTPAPRMAGPQRVHVAAFRQGARGDLLICEGFGDSYEEAVKDLQIALSVARWAPVPRRTSSDR